MQPSSSDALVEPQEAPADADSEPRPLTGPQCLAQIPGALLRESRVSLDSDLGPAGSGAPTPTGISLVEEGHCIM